VADKEEGGKGKSKRGGKARKPSAIAVGDAVAKAPVEQKPAEEKPVVKKAVAKKTAAKKAVAKKAVAKKAVAKKAVAKKAVAKKAVAKKAVAKKTVAKKTVAKKTVAKKAVRKPAAAVAATPKPAAARRVAPGFTAKPTAGAAAQQGSVWLDPAQAKALQEQYLERLKAMLAQGKPVVTDARFADPSWRTNDFFAWNAAIYEVNADFLRRMANALKGEDKACERVRFATDQWVEASSPANFLATNPSAQQRMIETGGESLRAGLGNLVEDMRKGRITQSDESAFEVGRNVATTPGQVVFENELIQLIQYTPTTERVGARPMLIVPPAINKFYVLDLQPANSVVAHLVAQGHTVFLVSWRNVGEGQQTLGWDDYLEMGPFAAIRVVQEISGQEKINALGFCVGGTILATALAALDARGERPVASLTLLTTLLDFEDPGTVNVFIDEEHVAWRESQIGNGGIMAGKDLATTFSMLRARDLVWNYVEKNYLKGEQPPAFDLLFWNADSTNLPGPMYCWYLRHLYLENALRIPGRLVCAGVPIDLSAIDVPTYVYGSREDHIVPWRSAYASTDLLSGPVRFVLGASGHLAGVINPPAKNRRNYWVADELGPDADAWFAAAKEVPGSWWPDWVRWLAEFRGAEVPAPKTAGNARYRPIEPAPGRYVRERVD